MYHASFNTYRLWDIDASRLIIGRHVVFNENSVLNRAKTVEISDSGAVNLENSTVNDINEAFDTT